MDGQSLLFALLERNVAGSGRSEPPLTAEQEGMRHQWSQVDGRPLITSVAYQMQIAFLQFAAIQQISKINERNNLLRRVPKRDGGIFHDSAIDSRK